jgi:prenyltransferase beta subunit
MNRAATRNERAAGILPAGATGTRKPGLAGPAVALPPAPTLNHRWASLPTSLLWLCLAFSLIAADAPSEKTPGAGGRDSVRVDKETEEVIQGALRWLVSKQSPNGSWGTSGEESTRRVAMTGYTLMAFMAAGQLPGEGEFGKSVSAGMAYLLDQTQPDGIIGKREDGQYMYGHGIATIALAELYGQTRSSAIKTKLERLVRVIIASQSVEGGWRYRPVAKDADISVTVLSLVAVRAAKNAGLEVPQKTIDDGVKYVKKCHDRKSGGFCYQPGASPGFARTSAAIYSLQVCGLYEDPMVKSGSEYLVRGSEKKNEHKEWFTYGNFYAAPAQYMIGGETWANWYQQMKGLLLEEVIRDGDKYYWDAKRDRGKEVGPTFCTSVYTMVLAMPYHYIPLYQR